MVEAGIRRVQDELALWRAAGQKPTFWIRDDDATCVTGQLERLQSIATRYDVSVGLALIPGLLQADLVDFLRTQSRNFHPMCHGWKHVDHGDAGNPNEFGNSRSHSATCQDATLALQAFRAHFAGTETVFVPPFNRITPAMIGALADIGYAGLSVGPRPLERRIARVVNRFDWTPSLNIAWKGPLPRIDAHVDLIDWQSGSAQAMDVVAQAMVGQLRLRRKGFLPAGTPIGLLTHHRVHDESIWRLLENLIDLIKSSLACEFIQVGRMFQQSRRERTLDPLPSA